MVKNKHEDTSHDGADDHEFGKEPNFEDPPGFVDDVTDEGEKSQSAAPRSQT